MDTPRFVAIDTETTGLNPWRGDRVFCIGAWFPSGEKRFWRDQFSGARELLADPAIDKVFHNAKFDLHMLNHSGFTVRGQVWDTMIIAHLLDGRQTHGGLNLDAVSKRYLPSDKRKVVDEVDKAFVTIGVDPNKDDLDFTRLPPDLVERRCLGDAELTGMFFNRAFRTAMTTFPWLMVNEHKLLHVVRKMEERGIVISPEEIDKQFDYFQAIVEECTDWFEHFTGQHYFSLTSRTDQQRVVDLGGFEEQLWDVDPESGKERIFMDDYHLRHVHHPAAAMLLVGKAAIKMRDTFLNQMLRCSTNNVLHPHYNQCGTQTGRFSCSEPNLQNIPIEGDRRTAYTEDEAREVVEMTGIRYAPHLKRIFRVRPGFGHLHTDKKQAEMVMVAHYSDDQVMKQIFASGQSIHDGLCRALYHEYTKGLKTRTKAVVFGFIYGAGMQTLAKKIGGTLSDARDARLRLERILPGLPAWKRKLMEELADKGFCTTIHGRRHYCGGRDSYKAVNYMCQGSVGDEIKNRMVAIDEWMTSNGIGGQVLGNIHDDIVTEFPSPEYQRVIAGVNEIMQSNDSRLPYKLPLPSSCDVTYTRWADLLEIDFKRPIADYSPEVVIPATLNNIAKETHDVYAD